MGVDQGVLYVGTAEGVPWNGLVSVSEAPTGGDATPYYVDGIKYLNRLAGEEFEATLEAYTYPNEFATCDGTSPYKNGLFVTQQKRKPFGLSYRTKIGNDVDGADHAYKIHLIYNALASPSPRSNDTITDSVDPFNFSWKLTTTPPAIAGRKPTSHFMIDTRETPFEVLTRIEEILYGSDDEASRLPTIPELVYIFESYNASTFDAGTVLEPYYATFDGGPPVSNQTSTVDGGAP
jgi:hypothetical protein